MFCRQCLAAVVAVTALVFSPMFAYAVEPTDTVELNLRAQPLDRAITDLAAQSGLIIGGDAALLRDKRAPALNGRFSVEQALQQLLAGSGVTWRYKGDTVVLQRAPLVEQPVQLTTINVTSEFTTRSLAETTTSVSVLTEEELVRRDSPRIYDAIRGLPNITPTPPDFLPSIRGVSPAGPFGLGSSFIAASEPRARLIVDDVARVQTYANNSFQSTFDIQQIEVLRGPQTTLRGNNTIAGAYVIKTNDPVFISETTLQAGLDWNEISETGYRLAAMANRELLEDTLAARFVVSYEDDRIPVEVYDDGSAIPAGTDFEALSEYDTLSLRGKFLFEPSTMPNLSSLLTLEYQKGRDIGFDSWSWGRDSAVFAPDGIERDPDDRLYGFSGGQPVFDTRDYVVIADIRYELEDEGEFRSISAYSDSNWDETFQFNPVFGFDNMIRERFSQDFVYTVETGQGLDVVLGFNYTREDAENTVGTTIGTVEARRSAAVFADLTYHLRDDLRLLGGGRLMRSEVAYDGVVFLPVSVDQRETVFLPKIGLAYDLDHAQTVSLTARRGFNPGGGSTDFVALESYEYDPEYVWTYEAGYRGAFIDDRVLVSATAFYNDYKDYQFRFNPNPTISRVLNFDGHTYGVELEVRARVSSTITLGSALGLLKTEVEAPGQVVDGNDFGEDPPVTLSANVVWQVTPALSFDVAANYVDEYFSTFLNVPGTEAGDYVNVDMGATYDAGRFQVRGYVRNLTDHYSYHNKTTATPEGAGYVLPPCEIGMTLTVPF